MRRRSATKVSPQAGQERSGQTGTDALRNGGSLRLAAAHRGALEGDAVGIVDEPVEDGPGYLY